MNVYRCSPGPWLVLATFIFSLFCVVPAARGATPSSGTLTDKTRTITYQGTTTTVNPATFDPSNCQTAGYCDVFTLNINLTKIFVNSNPNFRVHITFAWAGNTNEFDMYDYSSGNPVATSTNSFVTSQMTRLEHPANGTYTIYASFSLGVPGIPYTATIKLIPRPATITRLAGSYMADPDGKFGPQMFQFSSDLLLIATPPSGPAGQNVEPGIQIDPFGNIYISAIEGIPAGSDLWRSTDLGNTFAYMGQPDHSVGGGDEDLTLGFPLVGDPIFGDSTGGLYYSSLDLADINLQTSHDNGNTFIPGDSPAKVVDRMWLAGVGAKRSYLITVQVGADLNGTDSLIVTQSDDGGITYPNGAVISSAILESTPETGFHSNIVAFPSGITVGGTPNSSVYTTFTSSDGIDLYVASCAAPCNLPTLPLSGLPGRQSFTSVLAFEAPPHATVGSVFTPVVTDNAGNVYVAFSMQQFDKNGNQNGQNIYVIFSKDGGKTWSKAMQVNNPSDPNVATGMLPWITAGDSGKLGVFWYGTDVVGDPNNQTVFANAKWKIYYAAVIILGSDPTVRYVVASGTSTGTADQRAGVVHYGSICTQGLNCDLSMPKGNRELAEYAELGTDPFGLANITFSEDNLSTGSAFTFFTKQTAGPTLTTSFGSGAGSFTIGSGTGDFGFNIGAKSGTGRLGSLNYLDTSAHISMTASGFSTVAFGGNRIGFGGTGTLQDGTKVTFTAVANAGGTGVGTFSISWSGYSASGTLTRGQVLP
jgi:hypothetical protein